jgi:hypothetical protein
MKPSRETTIGGVIFLASRHDPLGIRLGDLGLRGVKLYFRFLIGLIAARP